VTSYLRIWLASARYSLVRAMMFRGDLLVWSLVELFWMTANVLMIFVLFLHTASIAGWNEYEMLLLVGTAMLIQRLLMGLFWSSLFEMGRNVRTGAFDFFLAQPGHPLFMASTRKLDPDGLANSFVALGLVAYAAHKLHLHPSAFDVVLYGALVLAGLAINYSMLVMTMSLTFWLRSGQNIEGTFFTLTEFSRLPREAFRGVSNVLFVWILPAVVVSNAPARTLLHGFQPLWALWLFATAAVWLALALFVFNRGIRRYESASS
jgi:viologen exporter family transport system permease protein